MSVRNARNFANRHKARHRRCTMTDQDRRFAMRDFGGRGTTNKRNLPPSEIKWRRKQDRMARKTGKRHRKKIK